MDWRMKSLLIISLNENFEGTLKNEIQHLSSDRLFQQEQETY